MKQEKINYSDIMALDFTEEECHDAVYFNQYGYPYCIIQKSLTERVYLDWAKETQLCGMVRIDNPKECNILKRLPIRDLDHLKEMIDFFSNDKESEYDFSGIA